MQSWRKRQFVLRNCGTLQTREREKQSERWQIKLYYRPNGRFHKKKTCLDFRLMVMFSGFLNGESECCVSSVKAAIWSASKTQNLNILAAVSGCPSVCCQVWKCFALNIQWLEILFSILPSNSSCYLALFQKPTTTQRRISLNFSTTLIFPTIRYVCSRFTEGIFAGCEKESHSFTAFSPPKYDM